MEAIVLVMDKPKSKDSIPPAAKEYSVCENAELLALANKIHRDCTLGFSADTASTQDACMEATKEMLKRSQ